MADLPPPPIPPPVGEEASLRHSLSSSSLENPEIAPEEEGEEVSPEIIAAENISRLLAELEISSKELGASFVNVVTSTQDSMDEITSLTTQYLEHMFKASVTTRESVEAARDQAEHFARRCMELDKGLDQLQNLQKRLADTKSALSGLESMVDAILVDAPQLSLSEEQKLKR